MRGVGAEEGELPGDDGGSTLKRQEVGTRDFPVGRGIVGPGKLPGGGDGAGVGEGKDGDMGEGGVVGVEGDAVRGDGGFLDAIVFEAGGDFIFCGGEDVAGAGIDFEGGGGEVGVEKRKHAVEIGFGGRVGEGDVGLVEALGGSVEKLRGDDPKEGEGQEELAGQEKPAIGLAAGDEEEGGRDGDQSHPKGDVVFKNGVGEEGGGAKSENEHEASAILYESYAAEGDWFRAGRECKMGNVLEPGMVASEAAEAVGNEIYIRNMCALWETDPKLAMMIEAVHPEDVPAVEKAREGGWTVKVKGVYLHSKYRPVEEAMKWAESQGCENRYAAVVGGFGLGHHVKALLDRMPGEAVAIVGEADLEVLSAAFSVMEYAEIIRSRRLMLFTQLDRGQFVERLEPRSAMLLQSDGLESEDEFQGVKLTGPTACTRMNLEFQQSFQRMIVEFVGYVRTNVITLQDNSRLTFKNIANNLGRYATTPPIDSMRDACKGKPAILVAAGPSLARNMHLLQEVNEPRRATIIAVQTMLKPLLAAGIDPDFVTSLDYNTVSTRFFENLEEAAGNAMNVPSVHLVAEAKANWNVLDVYGGTMSLVDNEIAEKLLRGSGIPPRAGLRAGATVAHLSFYLAEFLGCDPIILVGQDLGFVDGLYYKPGTAIHETWGVELSRFNTLETKEWERIVRSRAILRKIPDIHGHPMYTEEQFFVYLQQFERDFAASRSTVIDATEGGAKKQGVTVMTLQKAIDRYCTAGNGESRNNKAVKPWKAWKCDLESTLIRVSQALTVRRMQASNLKETCEAVLPVLGEMMAHQGDPARMQRLFIEVDRLRAKVGSDQPTFEMAAFLNAVGDKRRFQWDLVVKAEKDPEKRQRRQLVRDQAYVRDLRTGAERLIDVVDEALARLENQIAAAEAGKPWPREVAGASA